MSMTFSTLHSKTPLNFFAPKIPPRIYHSNRLFSFISYYSVTANAKPLKKLQNPHNFYGPFKKYFNGFPLKPCGFLVKAQNDSGFSNNAEKAEMEARGQSSMPERFRYLTTEAPDKPVRWPWLIVLAFMLYAWRAVLWELFNWKRALGAIGRFSGYISKLMLALIFHFIGDPVTSSIRAVETTIYTIRAFYSSIVAYAPIPDLTVIIMLTSAILATAEAAVPNSINNQSYILTVAGLIGFAAVRNYISEPFFWTLLVGLFGFARLVKKRDYVSSALPVAAVLAAVGEPWVRAVTMVSYLGLAIFYRSIERVDSKSGEDVGARKRIPVPLMCVALAVGIRVAAKWAGYRHLTWMVV